MAVTRTKCKDLEMILKTIWLIGVMLLAVSCSGDLDCRHKGAECAEGFSCESGTDGVWQCVKRPTPPAAQRDPNGAPPPPAQVRTPAPAETPCPGHPMCVGKPAQCVCGLDGVLLSRTLDRDEDGKPDEKAVYTNDSEGRAVQVIVDVGIDGTPDSQHSYTYNGHGNPLVWRIARLSKASADAKEQELTYVYDEQDNLKQEELDIGIDGSIDSTCTYSPPCPPPIPNTSCKSICK